MGGALSGVKVIELAGQGALPFATYKLGDMGADIIRVDRLSEVPEDRTPRPHNFWERGRRSIAVDLKKPAGVETLLRLAEHAQVLLESYRPGVAERLGIGPDVVLERSPAIVYGRLTGWGQDGPLSQAAGHSLNYESLSGVVRAIGPRGGPPVTLLPVVGDFGGGGLHLAYGVACALYEAQRSGKGQVVDVAMNEAVMSNAVTFYALSALGMHTDEMGSNLFDGGAPFYNVYETADGKYVSVGAIEPQFYAQLLDKIGLDATKLPAQDDQAQWPALREQIAAAFRVKTRDEWCEILEGTDACFAPVLTFAEAIDHPQHVARGVFSSREPMPEMIPLPRLSRTPGTPRAAPAYPGANTEEVLIECGFSNEEIETLRSDGVLPRP
jgi:alpha-methylacyl-CoA racemase